MATVKQVIDLARLNLNDSDKTRWKDVDLLPYVSSYVQQAVQLRPDLFIGQFINLPTFGSALTDVFPMPDRYVQACADYIVARAEMFNTEEGSVNKATAFMQLSASESGIL